MGHEKKYVENFSASSVADVTISFKSGRLWITWWEKLQKRCEGQSTGEYQVSE